MNLRIGLVQNVYERSNSPQELLDRHFTTVDWANSLTKVGVHVTVIYRFNSNHKFILDGVSYIFLKDNLPPKLKPYHLPISYYLKIRKIVKSDRLEVLHAHNLHAFSSNVLMRLFHRRIPKLIQDHGSVLRRNRRFKSISKHLLKVSLGHYSAYVFAASKLEAAYVRERIIDQSKCHFVMENSSPFSLIKRSEARNISGMSGDPIFLSVGHLDTNKDPLTVINAFKNILPYKPDARLYLIYRHNLLEKEVYDFLDHANLEKSVKLLGKKERHELLYYYNSADFIVSASQKEGSGYSIIEGISCGLIPILSDIPSFRALSGDGTIGGLFEVGNHHMLAEKMKLLLEKPIPDQRANCESFFKRHFSKEVIAKQMKNIYRDVVEKNNHC